MSARKIKNNWWVDFRFGGERYRKKSPVNTKAGALNHEAMLREKLVKGEPIEENRPELKKYNFQSFAWEWFEIYVKNNNKYSEIRGKKIILERHLIPFFGKSKLENITSMDVEKYKAKKGEEKLSKKTINNHLTVLNTCLTVAMEWLNLDKKPKIKRLKAEPPKMKFLSDKECRLILNNARGTWRDMIYLALKTGVRFGELRALKWEDVNWRNNLLTVKRSIFRGVIVPPKSNKERYVPLIGEAVDVLRKREKRGEYIFSDKKGKIVEENRVRRELWRACDRAGMERAGWHCLRHTFASHLAMKGAPLKSVQELLGHASITTTMRYAHLSPSTLRNSVELLGEKNDNKKFGQRAGTELEDVLYSVGFKDVK